MSTQIGEGFKENVVTPSTTGGQSATPGSGYVPGVVSVGGFMPNGNPKNGGTSSNTSK